MDFRVGCMTTPNRLYQSVGDMDKFHMEFGGLAGTNGQYFTTNKTSLNKTAEKAAEMLP